MVARGGGFRTDAVRQSGQRGGTIAIDGGECHGMAIDRQQQARLAGIGKKGDRGRGFDQDGAAVGGEAFERCVDRIGDFVDGKPPLSALQPAVRGRGEDVGPGLFRDTMQQGHRLLVFQHTAADQKHGLLTAFQGFDRGIKRGFVQRGRGRGGHDLGHLAARVPADVGGRDQRGDLARLALGDREGGHRICGKAVRVTTRTHPVAEGRAGTFDIRRQRRVVFLVPQRVIAHKVDHGHPRLAGVVQVGGGIGETGGKVQQGHRRFARHARIAIGGAGHHPLEQAQNAAHQFGAVQRVDELHLGGAGIGETDLHPARMQAAHNAFRAVHFFGGLAHAVASRNVVRNDFALSAREGPR